MSDIVGTGVKATPEEYDEALNLHAAVGLAAFRASRIGPEVADARREKLIRRIHEMALAHGLPEIAGWYGMDATG